MATSGCKGTNIFKIMSLLKLLKHQFCYVFVEICSKRSIRHSFLLNSIKNFIRIRQNAMICDGIWYDFGGIGVIESVTNLLTSDCHQISHDLQLNSTFGICERLSYLSVAEILPDTIIFFVFCRISMKFFIESRKKPCVIDDFEYISTKI